MLEYSIIFTAPAQLDPILLYLTGVKLSFHFTGAMWFPNVDSHKNNIFSNVYRISDT
jgi:hypothetical protein